MLLGRTRCVCAWNGTVTPSPCLWQERLGLRTAGSQAPNWQVRSHALHLECRATDAANALQHEGGNSHVSQYRFGSNDAGGLSCQHMLHICTYTWPRYSSCPVPSMQRAAGLTGRPNLLLDMLTQDSESRLSRRPSSTRRMTIVSSPLRVTYGTAPHNHCAMASALQAPHSLATYA
jgi:hypothetical protein